MLLFVNWLDMVTYHCFHHTLKKLQKVFAQIEQLSIPVSHWATQICAGFLASNWLEVV